MAHGPVFGGIFDPIFILPALAADRYRKLRDLVRDGTAVLHDLADRAADHRAAKAEAEARLRHLKTDPRIGDENASILEAKSKAARAQAELDRIAARQQSHDLSAARLLDKVDSWLRSIGPDRVLVEPGRAEVRLLKNETVQTAIERHRRRLRELDADRERVEAAPYPASVAKRAAVEQISAMADAATPIISNAIEFAGGLTIDGKLTEQAIVFATRTTRADVHGTAPGFTFVETPDALGLIAWLFRDQLVARIASQIDEESDDAIALTAEQRGEQLATIAGDRLAIEMDEGALLFADGAGVLPRADMTPQAFLGVQVRPMLRREVVAAAADQPAKAQPQREVIPPATPLLPELARDGAYLVPPSRSGA